MGVGAVIKVSHQKFDVDLNPGVFHFRGGG